MNPNEPRRDLLIQVLHRLVDEQLARLGRLLALSQRAGPRSMARF